MCFDETPEGWADMFTNNLHPIFYLAQAVAPGMKAREYGRIISFSMANADKMEAQPMVTAHYIAKAGILILTRTPGETVGPARDYGQCDFAGFYRFGECAAGRAGWDGEKSSGRVHRRREGYRLGRDVFVIRRGPVRNGHEYSRQRRVGPVTGSPAIPARTRPRNIARSGDGLREARPPRATPPPST